MEISLEKVDQVKERTGATYKEAKEALEVCNGDVLEAIIHIENIQCENINENNNNSEEVNQSIEEFKVWIKELVRRGNISRVRIKKDDNILVDVPVNAGVAATVIAVVIPSILAFGAIAAVATKLTIEITKVDGSVEVVNKYVTKAANEVKDKATAFAGQIRNKIKETKEESNHNPKENKKVYSDGENVYSYTVNFDEENRN